MASKSTVVVPDEHALSIFTDGSSYSGPRRGGLGYLLVWTGSDGHPLTEEYAPPGYQQATNNQMELMACVEALRFANGRHSPVDVNDFPRIDVYSDSQYVVDNVQTAIFEWSRNRWMKRDGNPARNADEWQQLVALIKRTRPPVRFRWCKGHRSSNPYNKLVDKLAKSSARGHLPGRLHVTRVGKKRTTRSTEIGSIPAERQELLIHVITDEYLRRQAMYAYKIEVIDDTNPCFGNVDEYFSKDVMLNARHFYLVRLNDDPKRPRIVENLGEVPRPGTHTSPN